MKRTRADIHEHLRLAVLLAVISCVGCMVPKVATRIDSEPPGARIEVNQDYVGVTPVDVILPQRGEHHRLKGPVYVQAIPVEQGQYLQQIYLFPHQESPRHLLFRMNNPPPPPVMPP